jgi:hypothetical protein
MRYQGIHKNIGTQYIRGISEWNGNPPGDHMWNTYSMNKEDIWVSRTRVPVTGTVRKHVKEDFEQKQALSDLSLWNLHMPLWAPVSIAQDPFDPDNTCLELRDEAPYEYAKADVAFPESQAVLISFRANQFQVGHGLLEVDVHDRHNRRALRLRFDPDWLSVDVLKVEEDPVPASLGTWLNIALKIDCSRDVFDLALNGKWVKQDIELAEPVKTVERLIFRTGPWRADVRQHVLNGAPGNPGLYMEDLPGADQKVAPSLFYIDDVRTGKIQ